MKVRSSYDRYLFVGRWTLDVFFFSSERWTLGVIEWVMTDFDTAIPPTDLPQPRTDEAWLNKHHRLTSLVLEASRRPAPELDIYFLGDSITEWWPLMAKEVWDAEFGRLRVLNCGASGDRTENILYRITHGEFEQITPRVIVLLAGINNLGGSPQLRAEELARGLERIVATLRAKSPASKILLLSIFPAGERSDPIRARIVETNKRVAGLADNSSVFYLDIYAKFLDPNGNLPATNAPDGLHLSANGYQIWADAMRPTLQGLLRQML